MTTAEQKKKKKITKKERHERFLGIKRYYREKAATKMVDNGLTFSQASRFIRILDRIGADDLENFLLFVGVRIPKSHIQMWTDVQKVDNLLNNLAKYRIDAQRATP